MARFHIFANEDEQPSPRANAGRGNRETMPGYLAATIVFIRGSSFIFAKLTSFVTSRSG